MTKFTPILAILILAVGIYHAHSGSSLISNNNISKNTSTPTPQVQSISATSTPMPTVTPMPSPIQTDTPTSTPTQAAQKPPVANQYIYPGSAVQSQETNKIIITSTSDTKEITDWYKQKLKDENLNINSFVTTSTNGNILNKLVAAGNNIEIRIEISKDPSQSYTLITIALN